MIAEPGRDSIHRHNQARGVGPVGNDGHLDPARQGIELQGRQDAVAAVRDLDGVGRRPQRIALQAREPEQGFVQLDFRRRHAGLDPQMGIMVEAAAADEAPDLVVARIVDAGHVQIAFRPVLDDLAAHHREVPFVRGPLAMIPIQVAAAVVVAAEPRRAHVPDRGVEILILVGAHHHGLVVLEDGPAGKGEIGIEMHEPVLPRRIVGRADGAVARAPAPAVDPVGGGDEGLFHLVRIQLVHAGGMVRGAAPYPVLGSAAGHHEGEQGQQGAGRLVGHDLLHEGHAALGRPFHVGDVPVREHDVLFLGLGMDPPMRLQGMVAYRRPGIDEMPVLGVLLQVADVDVGVAFVHDAGAVRMDHGAPAIGVVRDLALHQHAVVQV
jgi:hypothetical protein